MLSARPQRRRSGMCHCDCVNTAPELHSSKADECDTFRRRKLQSAACFTGCNELMSNEHVHDSETCWDVQAVVITIFVALCAYRRVPSVHNIALAILGCGSGIQ